MNVPHISGLHFKICSFKGLSLVRAQRPDDPPPRYEGAVAPTTKPDRGYWNYEEDDVYCIRSAMAIRLSFSYEVSGEVRTFSLL